MSPWGRIFRWFNENKEGSKYFTTPLRKLNKYIEENQNVLFGQQPLKDICPRLAQKISKSKTLRFLNWASRAQENLFKTISKFNPFNKSNHQNILNRDPAYKKVSPLNETQLEQWKLQKEMKNFNSPKTFDDMSRAYDLETNRKPNRSSSNKTVI